MDWFAGDEVAFLRAVTCCVDVRVVRSTVLVRCDGTRRADADVRRRGEFDFRFDAGVGDYCVGGDRALVVRPISRSHFFAGYWLPIDTAGLTVSLALSVGYKRTDEDARLGDSYEAGDVTDEDENWEDDRGESAGNEPQEVADAERVSR